MKILRILLAGCLLAFADALCAQPAPAVNTNTLAYWVKHGSFKPSHNVIYKRIDGQALKLHIFDPPGFKAGDSRPCFLVIHGGGWTGGTAQMFYPFAAHFAKEGLVGISIDYRLIKKGSRITPFDCVKDGRSAVRYVRSHAAELGIDPNKIIVSGGSAGGHVAACTALAQGVDEKGEDTAIPCKPDALVLYWPILDTSPKGWGNARCGPHWKEISPLQLVRPGMPPTLIFQGSADHTASPKIAKAFQRAMLKAGNQCELVVHPGGQHGYMMRNIHLFNQGMKRTDEFLRSLGYLSK